MAKCNCNDLFGAERCLYGKNNYCERISTSITDYEVGRGRRVSRAELKKARTMVCCLCYDALEVRRATKSHGIVARECRRGREVSGPEQRLDLAFQEYITGDLGRRSGHITSCDGVLRPR